MVRKWIGRLLGFTKLRIHKVSLFGTKDDELKTKFEKSVLRLLQKYKYYNPKIDCIQKVIIECSVDDLPIIKIETLVIEKPDYAKTIQRKKKEKKLIY